MEALYGLLLPFLGTSLGAASVFFMKKAMSDGLQKGLTGFAAGVMTAASVWSLLIPAIERSEELGKWSFAPAAAKALKRIEDMGFGNLPVCMAKTQYSLSDDQTKLGRPSGFTINVRDAYVSAGAGFVVALTGSIMTMPGLPKKPAADSIDVDGNGKITGLF